MKLIPELKADLPSEREAVQGSHGITEASGMSILDLLLVLASHKRLIIGFTLITTLATAMGVMLMRNYFTAQAVILPPQQQQSSLAAFASGALGGLAGSGVASQLGLKNPADLYIGILKSRTLSDEIVARFHLEDVYQQKFASDTQRTLAKHASFASGKDSLITISVEDHDPKRAAAMTNAFVDGLYELTSRLAVTDASQRRLFFEQELGKEKNSLGEAEVGLRTVQRSTGLLLPAGQGEALIRSTAQLRAEISIREVALHATETYATKENPQVQVLQREISAMRGQLSDLENKGNEASNFEVSAGKLPEASLEYIRKLRDLKYHETLYELLAKQYEAARIDESKQAPVIQVIDRANVPDKKSGPARALLILCAGFVGIVLSSLYVLLTHNLRVMFSNASQAQSLAALRSVARFKLEHDDPSRAT